VVNVNNETYFAFTCLDITRVFVQLDIPSTNGTSVQVEDRNTKNISIIL